jgi:small subunit ribosomal protein S16
MLRFVSQCVLYMILLTPKAAYGIIASNIHYTEIERIYTKKSGTMVKIRLRRVGTRNRPMYRVVAANIRSPRDGAFLEVIGHYNPLTDPETFVIDEEKALKWLGQGAQPTETVARLLTKSGVMEKFKPNPGAAK